MNLTARIAATFNRSGTARDNVVGAATMPAVSAPSKGSGARSNRRLRATLAVLTLAIAAFATTAAPASAADPTIGVPVVTNVQGGSVHLSADIKTTELGGVWEFQYSTDNGASWSAIGFEHSIDKNASQVVEHDLAGLAKATRYKVRLALQTFRGFGFGPFYSGPEAEFTTFDVGPPAVIEAEDASEISYTTATAVGKVKRPAPIGADPDTDPAIDLNCQFEYVSDAQFQENLANSVPGFEAATPTACEPADPVTAPGESTVTAHLAQLNPSTTYHLRLSVSNGGGSDSMVVASTFTTLEVDPPSVISTDNATAVEYSQAAAKGVIERPNTSVDPAFDVNCAFEYVTDEQFTSNPPGEEFAGATPVGCEGENPIHVDGQSTVEAALSGLAPSTKYHLRLRAENLGGSDTKDAAATFTTEGPIPTPSILSVEEASQLTYKTATVEGQIERPAGKDPALNTECRFEYVSDEKFVETGFESAQQAPCDQNAITNGGTTPVSAQLSELQSGFTYHLRLAAENAGGVVIEDATSTFTTVPGGDTTTTIDTPVMGYTTALVTGTVTRGVLTEDATVSYYIEDAEVGTENWSGAGNNTGLPAGHGPHSVSYEFKSLHPGTEYKFRIGTQLGGGGQPFDGPFPVGTTRALNAPAVTFGAVTGLTGTEAQFSGAVDTHAPAGPLDALGKAAYKTNWEFQCVPACPKGTSGAVEGEEGNAAVTAHAIRLEPDTSYEVKLVAHNEVFSAETEPVTFHTTVIAPTVESTPGAPDGQNGYTLQGVVNPNNNAVSACTFEYGPNVPYAFKAPCSPEPGDKARPVTVEAHLTGLTPGATYHARLVIEGPAFSKVDDGDQIFIPTTSPTEACANEELRKENNSLALPECRAYEMVSPPNKEGGDAELSLYSEDGSSVGYTSVTGTNIANSGSGSTIENMYVADRSPTGWETIPNLNGPTGSIYSGPGAIFGNTQPYHYSADLQSSLWYIKPGAQSPGNRRPYLRNPDGSFTSIGDVNPGRDMLEGPDLFRGASADLSHLLFNGSTPPYLGPFGPGVYEFVGTGNKYPQRVDVDNQGSVISGCPLSVHTPAGAFANTLSSDGNVAIFTVVGGCGGENPKANEIWARVGETTSYDASKSQCTRGSSDPGGPCNAPANVYFVGSSKDGSRIFFTTTQQLVNGDIDQTNDLYRYELPTGGSAAGSLTEVSAGSTGADVGEVVTPFAAAPSLIEVHSIEGGVSDDGSTAYFSASGVLATNTDALGETAVSGDKNFYVWRSDPANPAGETKFIGRLDEGDLRTSRPGAPQTSADGRYLVFSTASRLVPTDTDNARDVYRYDADTGELLRVSTNITGVGGNGGGFDATIESGGSALGLGYDSTGQGEPSQHPHGAMTSDGGAIVFVTSEALSPLDGNGAPDAYLWRSGHVSLISTGSGEGVSRAQIDSSGQDIFLETTQAVTSGDGDALADVYDARVGGGFKTTQPHSCLEEECQPKYSGPPPVVSPATSRPPAEPGNVRPRRCAKGKHLKKNKCIKKPHKRHRRKSGNASALRATLNPGSQR